MTDYKLVPVEPTPEMIDAAQDAYMPFGDMDIALRMAMLAAPDGQGEVGEGVPDARWLLDQYEAFIAAIPVGQENRTRGASAYNWHRAAKATLESLLAAAPDVQGEPVAWSVMGSNGSIHEFRFTTDRDRAEKWLDPSPGNILKLAPLYAAPQPAEQQSIKPGLALDAAKHLTNWLEMDICECEGGHYCGYNEVKRTRDALLEAAEQQPAPDVAGLVDALEEIAKWTERWTTPDHPITTVARKALAAHRKQGGEV